VSFRDKTLILNKPWF